MFNITSDTARQLLTITYSGRMERNDMLSCVDQIKNALEDMKPGFCVLADFSGMEFMSFTCGALLAEIMDLCSEKEIGGVSRVVPDIHKDIGLNILSLFHYDPNVAIKTYESLEQAMQDLA